jgi:MraZ protein
MFRGTYEVKVDEKGRVKLPIDVVKLIGQKNYGPTFFITSRDGQGTEIWPMQEWEKEEEKKAALPEDDQAKLTWMQVVNHYGQVVEVDKQDRLMLPRIHREKFKLVNEEVVVTGMLKFLLVRSQRAADEKIERLLAPRDNSAEPMGQAESQRILAERELRKQQGD